MAYPDIGKEEAVLIKPVSHTTENTESHVWLFHWDTKCNKWKKNPFCKL